MGGLLGGRILSNLRYISQYSMNVDAEIAFQWLEILVILYLTILLFLAPHYTLGSGDSQ